jgi:5'-nucleotidase
MRLNNKYIIFLSIIALMLGIVSCDKTPLTDQDTKPNIENPEKNPNENPNEESKEDQNEDPEDVPEDIPTGDNKEFVMLFTNDFHSQIEPTDKNLDYNADRGGAKRLKAVIDSVRTAEPYVLLADAGDLVQGTYYFSLLNGVVEMMMLDELGYDIRTVGNHEFDKKLVGLGEMFAMSKVPVVSTNYDFSNTALAQYVKSSKILNAGKLKIGFIGLGVMLEGLVDPTSCEGVQWQNAVNVADDEAARLREQGADMVIALSHLGYEKNNDIYYMDRGVALKTRNIDMIIGGHSHTFINYPDYVTNLDGEKVPIVQTGSKGICLGYAKIKLDSNGKPSFTYKLIPVKSHLDSKVDQTFAAKIDSYTTDVAKKMDEVIGYCPSAMSKGNPESPLSNLTADGLIWAAKEFHNVDADVSVYNSGGIRSTIAKGNLTVGDVFTLYPFDNVLSVITMKGSELKKFFNTVASYGGMPINGGVRLVISNKKVKSLTINGKAIVDSQTYTIATLNYLVNTESYFANHLSRMDYSIYVWDYFTEYFRYLAKNNNGQITASKDGRITVE